MIRALCFYSDYGYADAFAGICRGVIAGAAPGVAVIDITHGIPRHDVLAGALELRAALPYTPPHAVHLAVVDPGVGGERRAVAVRSADDRLFVGPDNGLLVLGAEAAGGAAEAVSLTRREHWLRPLSRTFHGRDIFAPVAALLAEGLELSRAGDPIDPASLVRLLPPAPRRSGDGVVAVVLQVDGFGNAALNLTGGGPASGALELVASGRAWPAQVGETFAAASPGALVVVRDSAGLVAVAVNGGSAAGVLGLSPGDEVLLRPWGEAHGV